MSWKIILLFFPAIVSTFQIISEPNDDSTEKQNILRTKFLKDKEKHKVTAKRIKFLEKYAANDSVLIDDILHYKIGHPQTKEVIKIEDEFRNMLAMDGLTYIYNRDMTWRTWRKVPFEEGARIVHYKYETSTNCTKHCYNGGYWLIEKNPPPCALEIFSTDQDSVCALNMKHYHLKTKKCSSYLFSQLTTTCDNPIVTKWIVQKTFDKKEKNQRFPVVICGGREYCRILTVYKIEPDHVCFKIINSTNNIIYSRIMKTTGDQYACINNCGIYDRKSNSVQKPEVPLKLNFKLNKKVEKREKILKSTRTKEENKTHKLQQNRAMEYKDLESMKRYILKHFARLKSTTHPPSCRNLQHNHDLEDDFDEEVVNDYSEF